MQMNRLCVYTKDIQLVTGKSERYCRTIIANIKKNLKIEKHQCVTIEEFCDYQGLKIEDVRNVLKR